MPLVPELLCTLHCNAHAAKNVQSGSKLACEPADQAAEHVVAEGLAQLTKAHMDGSLPHQRQPVCAVHAVLTPAAGALLLTQQSADPEIAENRAQRACPGGWG